MDTVTIRELHKNWKLTWAKSCFYLAMDQFSEEEKKKIGFFGIESVDKPIQFTFDGHPMDMEFVFDIFLNNMEKYIENKTEKRMNKYLDVIQRRMEKAQEAIRDDFLTIREAIIQGVEVKFDDEDED